MNLPLPNQILEFFRNVLGFELLFMPTFSTLNHSKQFFIIKPKWCHSGNHLDDELLYKSVCRDESVCCRSTLYSWRSPFNLTADYRCFPQHDTNSLDKVFTAKSDFNCSTGRNVEEKCSTCLEKLTKPTCEAHLYSAEHTPTIFALWTLSYIQQQEEIFTKSQWMPSMLVKKGKKCSRYRRKCNIWNEMS